MTPNKQVCLNFPKNDEHLFNFLKRFEKRAIKEGWTKNEIESVFDLAFTYSYHHILHSVTEHVLYNKLPE